MIWFWTVAGFALIFFTTLYIGMRLVNGGFTFKGWRPFK